MFVGLAEEGEPLESADADMAVAEPRQDRGAGRGGLVAALQRFAGLEQSEALRRVDPKRFEHFGRQHFANAAFERQPAIGMAAVRRLARALGAEIEQPTAIVAKLRESEAAAVADLRIVDAELMAVIAKRQRLGADCRAAVRTGRNARAQSLVEMQSDALGPTLVEKTRRAIGNRAGSTAIVEIAAERQESQDRAGRLLIEEMKSRPSAAIPKHSLQH